MECKPSDSKKIFKVFDASKRNHTRKKRDGSDDVNSLTDDSNGCKGNSHRISSAKASLQNLSADIASSIKAEINTSKRDGDSSPSVSPVDRRRSSHSPRRHRRVTREGISLALKGVRVSTPRSVSPRQDGDAAVIESLPRGRDSFIYALLEEEVKRDKRRQRHSRKHEEHPGSRERDGSTRREHRQRHRRPSKGRYKKDELRSPAIDQASLLETFAKLCAQFNEKSHSQQLPRAQSHKSLQCEVVARRDSYNIDRTERLHSRQGLRDNVSPSRIRSHDNFRSRETTVATNVYPDDRKSQCVCHLPYNKEVPKYSSKLNMENPRMHSDRYREYSRDVTPTRSCVNNDYYRASPNRRDYRDYDDRPEPTRDRPYEDKRGYCEQKTSRSFEVHRERYEERPRRTDRSDYNRDKFYPEREFRDKRYVDSPRDKYYDEKPTRDRNFNLSTKERSRRNLERLERNSITSRDDDYREKFSERERDSGLSVADGETSTMSGRSTCLRAVKQEISEQREAMDKMMKLWKELMRCFKGVSQAQGPDNRVVQESAANVRESAAAQLRLWRECMRRYETVARDVGDTDARLMEEINKQRSEMSEMATMWQECLQRYRDMSNDFNNLKQQLTTSESPTRIPAPPLVCAEGEGIAAAAPYRLPHHYPPMPPPMAPEYARGGSPLRPRASAPPAWWWAPDTNRRSPRRRSSPDSRGSRERRHRHRERDREDSRYKEKAKPNGARSEHRHRKR